MTVDVERAGAVAGGLHAAGAEAGHFIAEHGDALRIVVEHDPVRTAVAERAIGNGAGLDALQAERTVRVFRVALEPVFRPLVFRQPVRALERQPPELDISDPLIKRGCASGGKRRSRLLDPIAFGVALHFHVAVVRQGFQQSGGHGHSHTLRRERRVALRARP